MKAKETTVIKKKVELLYEIGDLVELARFGFSPSSTQDRVFGTVVAILEPTDYFVPRYKVRVQYMKNRVANAFDEYVFDSHEGNIITVMEYDIAGKTKGDSQD